jgi:hypothetical protein
LVRGGSVKNLLEAAEPFGPPEANEGRGGGARPPLLWRSREELQNSIPEFARILPYAAPGSCILRQPVDHLRGTDDRHTGGKGFQYLVLDSASHTQRRH